MSEVGTLTTGLSKPRHLVKKGDYVLIQGQLTYRKYNDDAGLAKYITEIVANEFMKITKN